MNILAAESRDGQVLGFTGKQVIHPGQIDTVNSVFSPSDDQIARARRIIEIYSKCQAEGLGAFDFEGAVIDLPGTF